MKTTAASNLQAIFLLSFSQLCTIDHCPYFKRKIYHPSTQLLYATFGCGSDDLTESCFELIHLWFCSSLFEIARNPKFLFGFQFPLGVPFILAFSSQLKEFLNRKLLEHFCDFVYIDHHVVLKNWYQLDCTQDQFVSRRTEEAVVAWWKCHSTKKSVHSDVVWQSSQTWYPQRWNIL